MVPCVGRFRVLRGILRVLDGILPGSGSTCALARRRGDARTGKRVASHEEKRYKGTFRARKGARPKRIRRQGKIPRCEEKTPKQKAPKKNAPNEKTPKGKGPAWDLGEFQKCPDALRACLSVLSLRGPGNVPASCWEASRRAPIREIKFNLDIKSA